MKVVATHVWPKQARAIADTHNNEHHSGIPTAHIDTDDNGGPGLPRYKVWCPICDDETTKPVIVWSAAGFLCGTISSVTWGIMIVMTTHRRRWDMIVRKWKSRRYLTKWEKVDPPRKMLAIGGRVVNIKPPEEV